MESYEKLLNHDIYQIFDGDISLGNIDEISIQMPYLKGEEICAISKEFGLNVIYNNGKSNLSRWKYMENILTYCIENSKIQEFLAYIFNKSRFNYDLKSLAKSEEIESVYKRIIKKIVEKINSLLSFDGYEFCSLNNKFIVRKLNSTIEINAYEIEKINVEYIKNMKNRAIIDIKNGDFDSAITKCRTQLEEVFIYVINLKNEVTKHKGDIKKLYFQVKELYNMHQAPENDKRINGLLSGLEKILTGIVEMRNNCGDAHGQGIKRIKIEEYHCKLLLNSSITMAEFILAVANNNILNR